MRYLFEEINSQFNFRDFDKLEKLVENNLPSGSGFDSGTEFIENESEWNKKLVFKTSFHHLNENGYYIKWTDHKIIITPRFSGIDIKVTGQNYNNIKEYISEMFLISLDNNYWR